MTIETLATQGRERIHTGLSGIEAHRLKVIRNASLRACFNRLEDTRHRLEFVARIRGREYVCDAASRSVNATWYALESTQGGIVWIADAPRDEVDYSRLVPPALRKVRMLLIVGGDSEAMHAAFDGVVPSIVACATMGEAVHRAYNYEADDVKVLYSPACSSEHTVEERAANFCREVNEL